MDKKSQPKVEKPSFYLVPPRPEYAVTGEAPYVDMSPDVSQPNKWAFDKTSKK